MRRSKEKWQGTKGQRLREERNGKRPGKGRLAEVANSEADDEIKQEKQLSLPGG